LSALELDEFFKQTFIRVAHKHLGAIADKVKLFDYDQEIVPHVRSVAASGHTPGHTALLIESDEYNLLHLADTVHNESFDIEHPEWQTVFDHNPAEAEATRRRLLDRAAQANTLLMAYHLPLPSIGYVKIVNDKYQWQAKN